jgi:hypothetical protein
MESNYKTDQKLKRQRKRDRAAKLYKLKGNYNKAKTAIYKRPKKQDYLYNPE